MREIVSGKGARFLYCIRAESDTRYKKYPPLPVTACSGYVHHPDSQTDKETAELDLSGWRTA